MKLEINNCYNMDCVEGMQQLLKQGIKADWLITDPPYGISINNNMGRRKGDLKSDYKPAYWDKQRVSKNTFDLMFECSDNQIIWGGNYYTDFLPPTPCWIIWDKMFSEDVSFAQVEMAWTNQLSSAKKFTCFPNGKDERIHPTQKPLKLLIWVLNKYTKENDLILDPFAGSQSLRVACHKMKRNYIGFEIDKEYYDKGCEWFNTIASQVSMFD